MERITYRITLDTHKTGIQRTLQGFDTADKMARRIAINLVASGDTFEMPMSNVVAVMYVTTPGALIPSVNDCKIEGNTIVYDSLPIFEEGITEMQLKLIESTPNGVKKVLIAPKFAVEVSESGANDEGVEQTPTFTALEAALAKADAVYNSRVVNIEVSEDCKFRVYYADGTVYESDYFYETLYNGNALISESFAHGGTGIREGEETDNSKYYSNVAKSASEDASKMYNVSHELLNESRLYSNYTHFQLNFETGELGYISTNTNFNINKLTGNLETDRNEAYTPEEVIESNVDAYIDRKSAEVDARIKEIEDTVKESEKINADIENINAHIDNFNNELSTTNANVSKNTADIVNANTRIDLVESIAKGATQAISYDTYGDMISTLNTSSVSLSIGQHIYIGTPSVPDLWVRNIVDGFNLYQYTEEGLVANDIAEHGYIQVGEYILNPLESEKIDLSGYAKKQNVDYLTELVYGKMSEGKFALIQGQTNVTMNSSGTAQINLTYPDGFDSFNCMVLGAMVKGIGSNAYICGKFSSGSIQSVNPWVALSTDNVLLNVCGTPDSTYTVSYRVMLYDCSIVA